MTTIRTQTANQWDIPNNQNSDLFGNEKSLAELFFRKHGARVRTAATGRYNCHGLTFASRRTCIEEAHAVLTILEHDGYLLIPNDRVLPGDVVLYYEDGAILHSGIVVEVPKGPPVFPLVVSKWGPNGAEFVHWVHKSEYGVDYKFFRIGLQKETDIISTIILQG